MKKIFTIFTSLVLILSGFLFSSCGNSSENKSEIASLLAAPKNTWCRMPVEYKNKEEEAEPSNLYAYFYFTDSTVTVGKETLEPGLSIVLTANTDSEKTVKWLASNAYVLKKFPKEKNADIDTGDDSYSIKGTQEKWNTIYWSKPALRQNKVSEPSQMKDGVGLDWDSVKENFSWKKLLAEYLLSTL